LPKSEEVKATLEERIMMSFITCIPHQILVGSSSREDEMNWVHSA